MRMLGSSPCLSANLPSCVNTMIEDFYLKVFLEILINFLTLIFPIVLVAFFRPGWVMILAGAMSFLLGLKLDSDIKCEIYKVVKSCSEEALEPPFIVTFFILGVIYSLVFLALSRLICPRSR
jgi:hypothetical protein